MTNRQLQRADQLLQAVRMFVSTLSDERAVEVATLYPAYKVDTKYAKGDIIRKGKNSTGDPQLYKVLQPHTSQADWDPATTPALYMPLGLNAAGYPVWSKPSGAHDAYAKGDIVDYNGTLYRSKQDGNVWSPEELPDAWEVYTEEVSS